MIKNCLSLLLLVSSISFAQEVNQTDENGEKHGKWVAKYKNGKTYYEVDFNHGIPVVMNHFGDGKQAAVYIYHDNGVDIEAMGRYYEKQRDSLWKFFYPDSILLKEEFYRKGVKHGKWVSYFSNGNKLEEKEYDNGTQIGVFNQYFTTGQLKMTVPVVNGEWQGVLKMYYDNGNIASQGKYVGGFKEGKWTFFERNGQVEKVITFKRGNMICTTEPQITYYESPRQEDANGEVSELVPGNYGEPGMEPERKIRTIEKYDKNCLGSFTEFFPTGSKKRTGFYLEGRKDSIWMYYNVSGEIDSTVNFQDGFKHGEFLSFHPNGRINTKEYYVGGVLHGIREIYDNKGALIRKEEFVKGEKKS